MQLKTLRFAKLIVGVLVISALASCAYVSGEPAEQALKTVGTKGQLISIQSDNVRSAGYDVETKVMTVNFFSGALYEYYGVQAELWNSFVSAQPHPWSQVGYPRLVAGGVPYKRIR